MAGKKAKAAKATMHFCTNCDHYLLTNQCRVLTIPNTITGRRIFVDCDLVRRNDAGDVEDLCSEYKEKKEKKSDKGKKA